MMLPEHLKLIRSYTEEQKKIPLPQLDEWDLHAIEETINIAIKRKCDVTIKMWRDGEFILRGGIIQNVDLKNRTIEVDDPFELHNYNLDVIVDVTVTD
ncbi:YolD-like family protein [Bacillus sp. Cr_A10]|uniref:YolD-like family protein n=1 Tax=Bacillus sp. Cr_A10 TaxID=3033993 RepID=UPI0023DACE02|nr:YolD-like family protein [Bacillus sp. Cr_A10]MDF2064960.1 YolD-like family protein [Bacillus sp. Cr_A10]